MLGTRVSEAFQRELSAMRQRHRGDIVRGTATFGCENPRCAVGVVKISFVEERGGPCLQWTLVCSRCRQPFGRYVGMEVGR